ncbi:MAG: ACT domain-containing protein [Candidatus ainarchaeum sp.]|nr:ACT domain-containing protein [Candidatus ainarchaeum sp.]
MNNQKISVANTVKELIEQNPYVRNNLTDGLINISALARKLAPELETKFGKKIKEESLIVAIRRYSDEIKGKSIKEDYAKIFANSQLSMQENMAYAVLQRNEKTILALEAIVKETDWQVGELRIIIQSSPKIIVLLKKPRLENMLSQVEDCIIKKISDKTLLTLHAKPEDIITYGVIAEIAGLLSKKGIAIEPISVYSDLHFLVDEKKAEEAYSTLKEFLNKARQLTEENNKN